MEIYLFHTLKITKLKKYSADYSMLHTKSNIIKKLSTPISHNITNDNKIEMAYNKIFHNK